MKVVHGDALVLKSGALRIDKALLGKLAGRKDLRFRLAMGKQKQILVLTPRLTGYGRRAVYYNPNAKSPVIFLRSFLNLYGITLEEGKRYPAERRRGKIFVGLQT